MTPWNGPERQVAQILTITIFLHDWKRDWSHKKFTLDGALVFLAEKSNSVEVNGAKTTFFFFSTSFGTNSANIDFNLHIAALQAKMFRNWVRQITAHK